MTKTRGRDAFAPGEAELDEVWHRGCGDECVVVHARTFAQVESSQSRARGEAGDARGGEQGAPCETHHEEAFASDVAERLEGSVGDDVGDAGHVCGAKVATGKVWHERGGELSRGDELVEHALREVRREMTERAGVRAWDDRIVVESSDVRHHAA